MQRLLLTALLLTVLASAGCGGKNDSLILLEELPTVGKITILNNEALSEDEIKSVMVLRESSWRFWSRSKFSRFQFEQDKRAILTLYLRRGYPRARVVSSQETIRDGKMDLTLTLFEGEQVRLEGVRVDLEASPESFPVTAEKLRKEAVALGSGDPFDPIQVGTDERELERSLSRRGYLMARSTGNVQFSPGNRAFLHYRLNPGLPYTIGDIRFQGLREVQRRSLNGFLEIEAGKPWDIAKVNDSQRRLMRGGYFLSVRADTSDVDPENRTVDVVFRVQPRKLKWVEGGVGLNSERQVVLNAGWGNRSFASSGWRTVFRDRLELDFDRDEPVSRNVLEAIVNKQAFFGTRWAFQPNSFWEYIDDRVQVTGESSDPGDVGTYTQNIYGVGAAFRRYLGNDYNQVVFSVENRWVYNDADSLSRASDSLLARDTYQTRLFRTSLDLDYRNDFFNPTRGGYLRFVGEFAGGALGGATAFNKFTVSGTRFWPFGSGGTFGVRVELGIAVPTGSSSRRVLDAERIPREDRYAVGGAYSVRGFDEEELNGRGQNPGGVNGGTVESLFNLEARWRVLGPLSGVVFMDSGNVWQDREDFSWSRFQPHSDRDLASPKDVRYAYGLGLRLNTPVGPVRIDYARKWNRPRSLDENKDRWHFALGHAF